MVIPFLIGTRSIPNAGAFLYVLEDYGGQPHKHRHGSSQDREKGAKGYTSPKTIHQPESRTSRENMPHPVQVEEAGDGE